MTSEARSWNRASHPTRAGPAVRRESVTRSDELSMLLRVTDAFSSGWKVSEILDSLYDELQAILPFDRLEYAVIDDTGYVLTRESLASAHIAVLRMGKRSYHLLRFTSTK